VIAVSTVDITIPSELIAVPTVDITIPSNEMAVSTVDIHIPSKVIAVPTVDIPILNNMIAVSTVKSSSMKQRQYLWRTLQLINPFMPSLWNNGTAYGESYDYR
jgi:hypothetical protein